MPLPVCRDRGGRCGRVGTLVPVLRINMILRMTGQIIQQFTGSAPSIRRDAGGADERRGPLWASLVPSRLNRLSESFIVDDRLARKGRPQGSPHPPNPTRVPTHGMIAGRMD